MTISSARIIKNKGGINQLTDRTNVVTVLILYPAVKPLGEVIEVVLPETVTLGLGSSGIVCGHTDSPTVVRTESSNDVTAVVVDHLGEKLGSTTNVVVDIPAAEDMS